MRLISFVGTGAYQEVAYGFDRSAERMRTPFITEALAHLLRPERVLLLLTAGAAAHPNAAALQARLQARGMGWEAIAIPDGRSQAELWQLFEQIAGLAQGASAGLDITHAFRSLPAVALLSAAYFQGLGDLQLEGLYYGAYEARDGDGRAPIFDLTAMLALPAWATAARAWRDHADGRGLALQLRRANAEARLRGGAGPEAFGSLAKAFDAFSGEVANGRHDLSAAAARLTQALARAGGEVSEFAPPLAPLFEAASARVAPLLPPVLGGQLAAVRLQLDAGQLLAATLMAREWLVSYWQEAQALASRRAAEEALGGLAAARDGSQPGALWAELGDLRNDLGHCGCRPDPRSGAAIQTQLGQAVAGLDRLFGKLAKG